ncbi:MAG: alpha/beta hydrolase [Gammaproteobacteria bacterium]|nr:alpha/beta hydrolase [Gammaproteobacteria bacterium]
MPSPVEPEPRRRLEGPTEAGFLYSDTGGDGPVVVFLHGVLMNGTLWSQVVDDLRHRYRCIVPELPFGAHPRPMPETADLSLGSLAKLIADFLKELQLSDVTLVCNDWGGAQLVVWPGRSTRVANLVLVSCEAFDNYPPGLPGRLLRLSAFLPGGIFLAVQSLRSRRIRRLSFTFGSLSKKGVPDHLFMNWIAPARHDSRIRHDLGKYLRTALTSRQLLEWAGRQKDYRGPVLIVWARDDRLMPPAHAERLVTHFPNAELAWIDDSRTLIPIDQPEILTGHLRRFLDAHTSSVERETD